MKELMYVEAVNEDLLEEMERDKKVFIIGEDVSIGYGGGEIFGATRNLRNRFGTDRVIDTPLSESALAGCGMGAALHHSQSFEAWFAHVPGLKVVMPYTPAVAKDLLKTAVRDNDPVIVMEHKFLYKRLKGPVYDEEYTIPIGKGDIKREGKDLTIIATGAMVQQSLSAGGLGAPYPQREGTGADEGHEPSGFDGRLLREEGGTRQRKAMGFLVSLLTETTCGKSMKRPKGC